ncbi:MAG TPA: type I polyketide synthase, partial [Kofleriaceae bacterium]|nr:type I polyketide synthase [Kofleriaceae bacterium]
MNGHALDAGGPRFAIVGMGCRLPGSANDHRAFWHHLTAGHSCVVDAPASRYDAATLVSRDPGKPGRRVGGRGGYIDGLDEFDPAFFGIGAREAAAMDPQQRKLLEVAWEALEDAGLRPAELAGRDVGVFIGASAVDYQILQFADPSFEQLSEHTAAGTALAMVAGRISHCFDFRGPSMAVDTADSSSLVAVHLACRSLAAGETSLALAGGVALDLAPQYAIAQTRSGWLSPDGRSRPFDAGANGRVRAEAAAVVVLKRLAEALRDGDPIHAVIAGSGTRCDGRTAGIAVPGGDTEIALIRRVCQDAGVSPGALQYVEAHAASMPVGDAIEASALGAVLADGREPNGRCCVGSVAGNLGHAGAAAGIAGLIKVALALKHKQIPPHIGLERINPAIDLARGAIEIPTRLIAWPPHVRPARAGVCAFGIGGTHAHVVIEEPPAERRPASHAAPGYNLLPLTAGDPSVFRAMAAALARELHGDHGPAPAVADVGYTLARRRQHLEARLCFVYSSAADLAEVLAHHLAGEPSPRIVAGRRLDDRRRRLAWVFTGAGAEWWAMGRELLASEPVYRGVIERCDRAIARLAGWSLIDELTADESASNMAEPCLAGPALFALQIGLAALCRSLGARPDAIVGHGAGELAAFHEAGVYSLEDAVQIAIHRGRLMHDLAGSGAMLAVGLSEAAAEARIAPVAGRVAIAAIDGPRSVALSGDRDALDAIRAELAAEQVAAQWLPVAIAYHSPAMDRIRDELVAALAGLHPRPAMLPLYLTAAEGTAGGPELDAAYWWRNVRDPVRFRAAIDRMIDAGCGVFLELGPHPLLGGAIADCLAARGADGRVVPSLRRGEPEPRQVMASLAALHAAGLDIAWDQLYPAGRIVPLPGYPWRRDRYWTEPAAVAQVRLGQRDHELLGRRLPAIEPVWEARIDLEQLPYLADHRLGGRAVFPAAGHLAMAAQAVRALSPGRCVALGEVELGAPLVLDDRAPAVVQLAIGAEASALRIASPADGGDAVVHATAVVRVGPSRRLAPPLDVAARQARAEVHHDAAACYAALAELGHDRGPAFRAIEEIWVSPGEALARVRIPASLGGAAARYHAHPCLLDACFQTLQCPD